VSGKVAIVGGAGRVGSTAAYALQLGAVCDEIALVDVAADAAAGEALDLTHGRAAAGGPRVCAGGYEALRGSEVVVVTAGVRRQPDESRLQLVERNTALFRQILTKLDEECGDSQAVLLVVTNPVDILTYVAATELGWPQARTIGLGTVLDTLRFRSLLAERMGLDPTRVEGMILGEHGDSMVPIFSSLRYHGAPISAAPGYSEAVVRDAFEATRRAGADVIRLKGGAGYAVGLAVREVVGAILRDGNQTLPVSTRQEEGEFAGVAFSLPTVVGRKGARAAARADSTQEEHKALRRSAEVLRETIAALDAATPKVARAKERRP
jgi:L-lactate dehydrogenase